MGFKDLKWKISFWKWQAQEKVNEYGRKAFETAIEATATAIGTTIEAAENVKDFVAEKLEDGRYAEKVADTAKAVADLTLEVAGNVKDIVEEKIDEINAERDKHTKKLMEHRILMLGGRRAGKSTILSSVLHALNNELPGNLCVITDVTDYTACERDSQGNMHKLQSLKNKNLEIKSYINRHNKLDAANQHINFVIDMTPTYTAGVYDLKVKANTDSNNTSPSLHLKFDDVPGEWMVDNVPEHATLKEKIANADVYVIAIDTPFLMQDDADLCDVYNRISEITSALTSSVKIENELDRKQIILCPVKCERWTNAGKADEVTARVLQAYRALINTWVNNRNVHIWVMPINTAGCVESTELLPAKLYFKDENDATGTACSYDELTGIIVDKEGNTFDINTVYGVEDDESWNFQFKSNHVDIPLSWYHCNGKQFSTRFCEQPAYHILKFIIEKEENVVIERARMERDKLENTNVIFRWIKIIFQPTFGQYIPVWKEMINGLNSRNLIKNDGDGFMRVTSFITE